MKRKRITSQSWKSRQRKWRNLSTFFKKGFSGMNKKVLLKNVILGAIALALLGSIFMLGAFAWLSRDLPDPNSLTIREIPLSTKIYDNTGEHLLYEIAGEEKRTLVTLDQIPEYVVWATITAEDRKFYDHSGIDLKGIIRAMLVNIVTLSPAQGASTITQQLVKNAILTNEKTLTRKFKEIILSIALERRYTKNEIMQLYLNEIPYGSRNYGIESASRSYYSSSVEDLSLAQAATLAALPQAPTTYLNNPDRLLERRDWIIGDMVELGYITQEEADVAFAEDTTIDIEISDIEAPHFVLWVKEQLEEAYGQKEVEQGGLTVTTTIDYDMQVAANDAVINNRDARSATYGFNNSGLVAINPTNGHIVSMVGSVDYNDDDIDGKVNVTTSPLQPGSSFKPIIYAAGFEAGYTPNTILWDAETTFGTATGPYSPRNYDLDEHGPTTIRSALQGSLNIPAVKMLYLIGVQTGIDFAQRMHYTTLTDASQVGLSMVLGGGEVELLEHTSAYGIFANDGVYHEPVSILKVEDDDGEVLEEWEESNGERVLEANIARMVSNVLSDNSARAPYFGSSSYLVLSGRQAAAKTGTTNDSKDAWTMGYTPSLVAGVWTGNTDGRAMGGGAGGSSVAAPIWNEFMNSALAGTAAEGFISPEIPVTGKAMLDGEIPSELVRIDKASGKLATDRTPESYVEEKYCGEYHTILTYVKRSDPLGAAPDDPASADGAYESWESAVQAYLERHNAELEEDEVPLETCEIPEDEDDLHVVANEPDVKIKEPDKGDEVGREIDVELKTSAPRGVDQVEYYIDDVFVASSSLGAGMTLTLPSWVDVGEHILKVVAYDDIDNRGEDEVRIDVTEAGAAGSASITNPFDGQSIEITSEPYQVAVELSDASSATALTLTALNLWTGETSIVAEIAGPSSVNSIAWTIGVEGEYILGGTVSSSDGDIDLVPVTVLAQEPTGAPDDLSLIEEEEVE